MSNIINSTDLTAYLTASGVTSPNATIVGQVTGAVNKYIETRTHRFWGDTTQVSERYDWAPLIYLRHQDVQAIDSIVLGYPVQGASTSTLTADSYFCDSFGRVTMYLQTPMQFNPSAVNNDLVLITYTYGVLEVPEDLFNAALGVAGGFYNWSMNGQKDVVATSVGSYRLQFAGGTRATIDPDTGQSALNPAQNVSDLNWLIIDSYRMRRL